MLFWPMIHREMKLAARRRDTFVLRAGLVLCLGAIGAAAVWGIESSMAFSPPPSPEVELKHIGEVVLVAILGVEGMVTLVFVSAIVGGAIAEERAKDTLSGLLLTRLTARDIVLGKLLGRLPQAMAPLAAALPLILLAGWAAALPPEAVALTALVSFSTVCVVASLGIVASARVKITSQAQVGTGALSALVLIFLPVAPFVPVAWAGSLAPVLEAFQATFAWLGNASPLSLVTDLRWMRSASYDPLVARLLLMFGLQTIIVPLAVLAASASLDVREREKRVDLSRLQDPYRGFRPVCRDDPILWREHELPYRRGSLPRTLIILRCVLDSLRILRPYIWYCLQHVIHIVRLLLMLAFQLAPIVAGIWLGYPAFVELSRYGLFATDAYQDRTRFNVLLRIVTFAIGLIATSQVVETAGRRITLERDKETWTMLLTTPLSGAEILGSKMRASIVQWTIAIKTLPVLLIAGALCGAIHPLGLLFILVDLPLATWGGAALGTWIALRSPSSRAAQSSTTIASLGFLLFHGVLLIAAASSFRDVSWILHWEPRVFWALAALMVVVPLATGVYAWKRTCRMF
ncbi:MAG TPA: hypothetical protein VGY53_12080, partial [Isosphaeraceae bacterium]|nr:hypothetical protein [Isosphaeraceae bacterium]